MTKPFSLQTVLELMQIRADDATQNLSRLIANERDAKNKLDLLQQYRDEYATRFQHAAKDGINPREWHNYQEFLSRLDQAIDTQRKMLAQQAQKTAAGQVHWQQQRTKLKAFDTLSERHFANETTQQLKREQKTQDEFAARYKNEKKVQ